MEQERERRPIAARVAMSLHGSAQTKRMSLAATDLLAVNRRWPRREPGTSFGPREWVLADLSYAVVATAAWLLLPAGHALQPLAALAAVTLFIAGSQVGVPLEVGAAALIQPAFVLLLFVVPLNQVLAVVVLCRLAGDGLRRRPLGWLALTPGDCWYAVPPTLIIALGAPGPASWSHWPVYALAFGAQFGFDLAAGAYRRAVLGHAELDLGSAITPVAIDICLTPIGLAAAVHIQQAPAASVVVLAGVLGLAAMFARERSHRLGQQHEALHDRVTGLPNRASFDDLLDSAARRCSRQRTCGAVLLLDLNRFKEINDSRGHPCGDAVLKAVGERLRTCVRESDTVARIGGDEFAVLLADPASLEAAQTVAGKVREALRTPLTIPDVGELVVSASTGAAIFGPGTPPACALAEADVVMYAEKHEWSRSHVPGQSRFR